MRELRERTLRRHRQLLYPAEDLYSDSDSDTEPKEKVDQVKSVPLSKYKRDLYLTAICSFILSIAVNLLVLQYLLTRRV